MKIAKVIVALDMKGLEQTKKFVDLFSQPTWFKVGMENIYSDGFEIINYLKSKNHKVFLDLKLHDIPNTVKKAMSSIEKHNVDMTTVHACGGFEMLKEASKSNVNVLAVTVLTSMNSEGLKQIGINKTSDEQVSSLVKLAKKANLFGIVCSPLEARIVKQFDLIAVTPGIRREQDSVGDQKRITTPKQAKEFGSDYIVVGRPITESENPFEEYKKIVKEFENE